MTFSSSNTLLQSLSTSTIGAFQRPTRSVIVKSGGERSVLLLLDCRRGDGVVEVAVEVVLGVIGRLDRKCLQMFAKKKDDDELLLKFCDWNGAKGCESDRSRQALLNEYLVAKIGFDTSENEPPNR